MIRRLLAAMVGLTLLILLVHDVPLASHLRSVEHDRLVTSMERDAFTVAGLTEENIESATKGDATGLQYLQTLTDTYGTAARSSVAIHDERGRQLAITEGAKTSATSSSIALALDGVRNTGTRTDANGERVVYVAVPILSGPRSIGAVEIVRPAAAFESRANARLRGIAIAAGISLVLAAGIGWLLARTLTKPLVRLRNATAVIASGELTARAEVPDGPPEIRLLAEDFNAMVDQLEHLVEEQRDFTGDVSHQLRTPLTTIQLRLEQILAMVGPDDPTRAPLVAADAELRRLGRTVEGLLAIARSDQTGAPITTVDVAAIARDRCAAWEPLVAESGVELVCDVPAACPARAVVGAVEEIIDNYLDNALETAPNLTRIEVRVATNPAGVVCDVIDDGPGLSDDELDKAFERFWRGAHSNEGGHGVGLAVVERLANACRGQAALHHAGNGPRSGVRASLQLRSALT